MRKTTIQNEQSNHRFVFENRTETLDTSLVYQHLLHTGITNIMKHYLETV